MLVSKKTKVKRTVALMAAMIPMIAALILAFPVTQAAAAVQTPHTGDSTNIVPYVILLVVALIIIAACVFFAIKKKNKK